MWRTEVIKKQEKLVKLETALIFFAGSLCMRSLLSQQLRHSTAYIYRYALCTMNDDPARDQNVNKIFETQAK